MNWAPLELTDQDLMAIKWVYEPGGISPVRFREYEGGDNSLTGSLPVALGKEISRATITQPRAFYGKPACSGTNTAQIGCIFVYFDTSSALLALTHPYPFLPLQDLNSGPLRPKNGFSWFCVEAEFLAVVIA